MMARINAETFLYGVLGHPVSHSLSPLMHNAAFDRIGYNAVYLAFDVQEQDLVQAISGIRALGIRGASVTIPHKIHVMEHLDEIDETALKIGAVNTIVNRNGHLYGYNSDCLGAMRALRENTDIRGKKVIVAGAGGAARAIGFGILEEGGELTILSHIRDEGERLAAVLDVDFHPLSEHALHDCDILINTTPLGMSPRTDTMAVTREFLKKDMVVMDIVYNPLRTLLLKEAETMGCTVVDGLSMFVYQGASQFESWTGRIAPSDLMREVVLKALGGK